MKLVSMLLLASASAQVGKTNLYRKPEPTATPAAINEVSTLKAAHGKPRLRNSDQGARPNRFHSARSFRFDGARVNRINPPGPQPNC